MAKGIERIDLYLQWQNNLDTYNNTEAEGELVTKFQALYSMADSVKESNEFVSTNNIRKWRKAYYGTLETLDKYSKQPSDKQGRQLRKLIYEFEESKVDNSVPLPKMKVAHKSDLPLTTVTEDYLRYCVDRTYTKYLNDKAERAVMTDGMCWYKIWWDNTVATHEHSGMVKIDLRTADQIVPQPGVTDYTKLEYIFELEQMSVSKIYDVYGRLVTSGASDASRPASVNSVSDADRSTVTVINCYYLNSAGLVGKFSWVKDTLQVVCNEEFWQVRRIRKCTRCDSIVRTGDECPYCGNTRFKYRVADEEVLDEDLVMVYNPYDAGETDNEEEKDQYTSKAFASRGETIPFYQIRQLPFIPRYNVSTIDSLYGLSEPFLLTEMQDAINKCYSKIVDKTLDSSAILVKPQRVQVDTDTEGVNLVNVRTYEESESVRIIQAEADTSQDVVAAQMLYESAKSSTGISDAYQGKYDASALSGVAKEFSASQTAGRLESYTVMKAAAFADIYAMVLKYLLAFSDESRGFVKTLPDGDTTEEVWNKYMFLARDEDTGEIYYRDDFEFETDPAATLAGNRVAMWQELQAQFTQGTMGDANDARTRELFWNMMSQQQYPLADEVLAGIKENAQHLPSNVEQMLLQNPEILQQVMQQIQQMQGEGGEGMGLNAHENAGRPDDGMSHAGTVEANNEENRILNTDTEDRLGEGGEIQ